MGAKVVSTDAIKQFRSTLIKFAETVNAALGNADSDVNRAQSWLDMEAKTYWQSEIRKAQQKLGQAMEALRMKTLYKNVDGTTPSAVDEQKVVTRCKARLEFCDNRLRNVQRYSNLLQRESVLFKGSVQRFSTTVQATPMAVASLDRVLLAIERYVQAQPTAGEASSAGVKFDQANPAYAELLESVTRPAEEKQKPSTEQDVTTDAPLEVESTASGKTNDSADKPAGTEEQP